MTGALIHRGPDGEGHWFDAQSGVGLGHRRLAILDLSEAGAQPMVSRTGRYVITYNGEVYNFRSLQARLEKAGIGFRGHSDTEVMLAAFEAWGVQKAIKEFIGMFAFALWDRRDHELWLCRDRLGKKPLYYGQVGQVLVFASELKGLRAYPNFSAQVDRASLTAFLRHNYIPAPRSIYEGIRKLEPGHVARFKVGRNGALEHKDETYWSAAAICTAAAADRRAGEPAEVEEQLDVLLRDAVAIRMISDVPLGVFLSGGIDSSLITALMQVQSRDPIKTFTIGFQEMRFNEAGFAKEVADRLGTAHTEVYLSPQDALNVIPRLPDIYDEPFADSSQIPTYLVAQIARRDVTVALSGDGGDELFCGYNRYFWWRQIWNTLGMVPEKLRPLVAGCLTAVPVKTWDHLTRPVAKILPQALRFGSPGEKIHKLARLLTTQNADVLYQRLVSHWADPEAIVIDGREPPTALSDLSGIVERDRFTERMLLLDSISYLPDDILVKVDRASMAVSLEARSPLLDHRVFEFAAKLPIADKLQGRRGKVILRRVLSRYLPTELFDRQKTGFGVPIDSWLRGPLRPWAEDLLAERRLASDGYFRTSPIRRLWSDYLAGRQAGHYLLWDVLMFQAWLSRASGSIRQ